VTLHGTLVVKLLKHQSLCGKNLPRSPQACNNSAPTVVQEGLGSENEEKKIKIPMTTHM
jgi:hypothetical protein